MGHSLSLIFQNPSTLWNDSKPGLGDGLFMWLPDYCWCQLALHQSMTLTVTSDAGGQLVVFAQILCSSVAEGAGLPFSDVALNLALNLADFPSSAVCFRRSSRGLAFRKQQAL